MSFTMPAWRVPQRRMMVLDAKSEDETMPSETRDFFKE
jgi:hypothetical protein